MIEQMNVPKLRFSEFEGDWKSFSLISLLSKVIDYRGQSVPKAETGIPLITAKNVKKGYLDFSSAEYVGEAEFEAWATRGKPQGGDVLFTTEAPLGNVCLFPSDRTYAVGQRTVTLVGSKKLVNSYLFHLMLSPKVQKSIDAKSSGTTAKGIKSSELKKLPVTVSNISSEQQKIASFLSKVDEKISLLTEKKAKLTEYKKGVMQQLFDGKWQEQDGKLVFVPPTLRFQADDGSEFPDWDEKKLGDFYKNLSTGMTPSRKVPEYFKGENLWITSGELNFGFVNDTKEKITEEAIKDTSLKVYPAGTFFIAITGLEAPGTRGRCAINAVPATTNQSCMAFVRLESVDTNFLYFWYSYHSEALYCKYAQGTKQQSFNNSLIEGIPINLPAKVEQTKIANFLSSLDQKIGLTNSELDKAKEWKKGLLQQMFV